MLSYVIGVKEHGMHLEFPFVLSINKQGAANPHRMYFTSCQLAGVQQEAGTNGEARLTSLLVSCDQMLLACVPTVHLQSDRKSGSSNANE